LIADIAPQFLCNLSGIINSPEWKSIYEVNLIGSVTIFETLKNLQSADYIPKVIIMGSAAEYGLNSKEGNKEDDILEPITHYGISKAAQTMAAQKYIKKYGLNINIIRPANVIGPGQSMKFVVSSIAKQIVEIERGKHKNRVKVGNIHTKRDFVDVRDVVCGIYQVLQKGTPGKIYNISNNKPFSVKDIIEICKEQSSSSFELDNNENLRRTHDIQEQSSDNAQIINDVGWKPEIDIEKSVEDILNYYRKQIK